MARGYSITARRRRDKVGKGGADGPGWVWSSRRWGRGLKGQKRTPAPKGKGWKMVGMRNFCHSCKKHVYYCTCIRRFKRGTKYRTTRSYSHLDRAASAQAGWVP